jgi:hypothetical protein
MEQNPQIRTSLAIYDLIDAENVDAREIAQAVRNGDNARAEELAVNAAPITQINDLLALSNLPIEITVIAGDQLMASKRGSAPYPAAQLSDGERNALLIGAEVLTAKPGMLLVIDEPERHLHRSIISPLLSRLFKRREDCAFVIATHDLILPIDNSDARVLLVRSCNYADQQNISAWDADLLPQNAEIDEDLKRDIVGARRRIIFVEGQESSLDKPLYSIVFPDVSVRAKGSAREVQQAVEGIRAADTLHWVRPFGIIDNDGRTPSEMQALEATGVYALPFYSVESIYYHPDVIRRIAERQAAVIGGDANANAATAIQGALQAFRPHLDRLSARAVEKMIRGQVFAAMPTAQQIEQRLPVNLTLDTDAAVRAEIAALTAAADQGDWLRIATRCPIRETPALDAIARAVGLRDRYHYESAVLQALRADANFVQHLRGYFGGLPAAVAA